MTNISLQRYLNYETYLLITYFFCKKNSKNKILVLASGRGKIETGGCRRLYSFKMLRVGVDFVVSNEY